MLKNYKKLVAIFILLFLLLVGIQVYFLVKTYKIKERQTYDIVTKKLDDYHDRFKKDYGIREDTIQEYFVKYRDGKMSKEDFVRNINKLKTSSTPSYSKIIDSIFVKDKFQVATKYDMNSTLSVIDNRYLFTQPITVFETSRKVTKPGRTENGTWETSSVSKHTDIDGGITKKSVYKTKTSQYYEIKNINSIVFGELWILILCCILILGSVLWIFILTVKNLINQQKQVEVLHTVVDNISHEFKTPIATLKIASKALKKDWNPATLPLIERQISRLESLMNQLHNDDETHFENLEIAHQDWNDFVEDLKFPYPEMDFSFKNNSAEKLPFNKVDMETIIKNLSENSIKYGASKVEISLENHQNQFEIKISDNGKGIEKKEQKNIFEKFYRIQHDNIHNTKGLGLGLFLVKNLVEKYHGKIELSSEINKGSTFKIILPYEN